MNSAGELSMQPLAAILKEINGARFWCCGVRGCSGKLGTVTKDPIPPEPPAGGRSHVAAYHAVNGSDALFIALPDKYVYSSKKGAFMRTERAASRSEEGARYRRIRAEHIAGSADESSIGSALYSLRMFGRERNPRKSIWLESEDLPVLVSCPSCKRVSRITAVNGIPA